MPGWGKKCESQNARKYCAVCRISYIPTGNSRQGVITISEARILSEALPHTYCSSVYDVAETSHRDVLHMTWPASVATGMVSPGCHGLEPFVARERSSILSTMGAITLFLRCTWSHCWDFSELSPCPQVNKGLSFVCTFLCMSPWTHEFYCVWQSEDLWVQFSSVILDARECTQTVKSDKPRSHLTGPQRPCF